MRNWHLILLLLLSVSCNKKENETKLPNIVLILADDLGYGDPSCYNSESKITTPNIDQLATEGLRFTDAHSASAVCTPTRYSILTGRYCWRTHLKKSVLWPWDKPLIEKTRLTLPEMLKQKGYQTAAIGKWHLGWEWAATDTISVKKVNGENVDYSKEIEGGPLSHGFDYYFGDDVPNFPPYTFIENQKVVEIPTMNKPDSLFGWEGKMVTDWKLEGVMPTITKKSIEYINLATQKDEPFFLYFSLTAPHTPIAPLTQFEGKSKAGKYGDFVYEVDWSVGQIMNALKQNGVDENTLVIFTSDNGSPARNGENWSGSTASVTRDYGHHPSAHLRGMKSDIWEGGHRVPFIAKWIGNIPKGNETSALITSMDLMPTIADIIGFEIPNDAAEDSYSIIKTLNGKDNIGRDILVNHSGNGVFALRKGKWKLIMSDRSGGFSDGINKNGYGIKTPGQLYNLKNDPGEKNNLYNQLPDKVKELKTELEKVKNKNI